MAILTVDISQQAPAVAATDRWVQRRVSVIWGLLIVNCLTWIRLPTVIPFNRREAQIVTVGALLLALVLALTLNPRLVVRPNAVLVLLSLLAVTSVMTSVRGTAGVGAGFRCLRLFLFLTVLWLLTPWWGRRDLLLARAHFRVLLGLLALVAIGLAIAPSAALNGPDGRLIGALWPMWPTAVAHYAAMSAGIGIVLWLSGSMASGRALVISAIGVVLILLSQTRTAVIGLAVGIACAAVSLFISRRRVRRALMVSVVALPLAALALAPAFSLWFTRNQTRQEISGLTGRTRVWTMLVDAPRSQFGKWFGYGLSDKSFEGLPIDNSWLAVYQDQGLVGVAIVGAVVLTLLVGALRAPPGPARALATFIVVYGVILSSTEVGFGDASVYLLELVVAASLLAPLARAGEPAPVVHVLRR